MTSFNAPVERDINWGPERTSILAIIALVFALPCFIPLFGIIASLLAVFALVGIASSKGRVGGTGLAIAALVLGLFSTALWTALGYGAWQAVNFFDKQIVGSTAVLMNEIKDGEWDKAKGRFVPVAAQKLTPEMFEQFRTDYREKLGEFQGGPKGLGEMWDLYKRIGPLMKSLKNPPNNIIPLPLYFAKGPALLMMEIDPSNKSKPTKGGNGKDVLSVLPVRNLSILGENDVVITLIDPEILPSNTVIELKGDNIRIKTSTDSQSETPEPAIPPGAEAAPPAPKKPS
ncbi:MAG: hypothetical protein KF691_02765 [Phycisphaeraceae bacterium]|nr:hypothetical protein [Phycisphaeraceae bacterium]